MPDNLDLIISRIEDFAPPELAEKWDSPGWQVYLGDKTISKVMLALTATNEVICQAVDKGCELLITHHPLYFSSLDHKNLQIYSAHTNLDFAPKGIAFQLLNMLAPVQEEDISETIKRIKTKLGVNVIKLINPSNITKITRIAVTPGSGGSFIPGLKNIDLYITGDVKYHDALEVKDFAVIDAGHFETERIILPVLLDLLKEFDIEVFIAEETPPWEYV